MHLTDTEYAILSAEPVPTKFPEGSGFNTAMTTWRNWCASGDAPLWSNVDLVDLPPHMLPNTVIVDAVNGGEDYRYRFWGTGYSEHYGIDETKNLLSESIGVNFIKTTFEQLGAVISSGAPRAFHVTIKTPRSGIIQTKFNLRLPVIDETGNVEKIITVSEFGKLTYQDSERLKEAIEADKERLRSI